MKRFSYTTFQTFTSRVTLARFSVWSSLTMASGATASPKAEVRATSDSMFPSRSYHPTSEQWPYKPSDFARYDESPDELFYAAPRINVQHIDDHAISSLKQYYAANLPCRGRILDLCSSWTSHFPPETVQAIEKDDLHVFGVGMNDLELKANPVLNDGWVNHDLNADPQFPHRDRSRGDIHSPSTSSTAQPVLFDAATCVVSIDYLTRPREVLEHLRTVTKKDGIVHLVISARRFPTKAVRIWEGSSQEERLELVGDYLHFAGWRDIEIVEVSKEERGWLTGHDPLWVVRGVNKEA